MHNTAKQVNHHVQMKTKSSKGNPSKMACEKASRRLRTILVRASRLGVNTAEATTLPSAKKLISRKDHGWRLAVFVILMFGGLVIVTLICTILRSCSRTEEVVSTKNIKNSNLPYILFCNLSQKFWKKLKLYLIGENL